MLWNFRLFERLTPGIFRWFIFTANETTAWNQEYKYED